MSTSKKPPSTLSNQANTQLIQVGIYLNLRAFSLSPYEVLILSPAEPNGYRPPAHNRLLYGSRSTLPLQMEGQVISGFGRGSKELGIPTIDDNLTPWISEIKSGVYFGWASLRLPPSHLDQKSASLDATTTTTTSRFKIYPMVMSIGYNRFYKNTVWSAEVHVLHEFEADFHGVEMRLLIVGFIREERDYAELEALIEDIMVGCDVARKSLDREAWTLRETGKGILDGSWLVRETPEQDHSEAFST